jgi:hypothetical protein
MFSIFLGKLCYKKNVNHLLAMIVYLFLGACGSPTSSYIAPSPSVINTLVPLTTLAPSPTSSRPQVPALVKTSLEFYRNGKTYEIIVGYTVGNAFHYATPQPEFPSKWDEAKASSAEFERYGDLDNDGEIEFIVSLMYCGAYCSEAIQIYEYDVENDKYFVADQFSAKYPAVDDYTDINGDGNLELITANYGFCYNCATGSRALSALTILRYENGKFVDVTDEFLELIQKDAVSFLKSSKANKQNAAYTTLPAYLYDMYRLGKIDEARPVFDQVCSDVVKPSMSSSNYEFDCAQFRTDVEKAITEFKVRK